MNPSVIKLPLRKRLQGLWQSLRFTLRLLRLRLREDRLVLTAGSLTFTTVLSVVPLLAVALAVFTAFPAFGKFQAALQDYLIANLIPDALAQQVMRYLGQFAGKARGLTLAGLSVVVFTAVTLMLTIDRSFNAIWRVQRPRPLAQRVLVYWAAVTLGPVLLGGVFTLTSLLVGSSRGVFVHIAQPLAVAVEVVSWLLTGAALAAMYRLIPNAQVSWRDALTGGLTAALAFELAKRVFTGYVTAQPTYTSVYGAAAVVPLFLVWVFTSWLIVLAGAVVCAYLPAIRARALPKPRSAGASFMDAIDLLRALHRARLQGRNAMASDELALALQRDSAYVNELAHLLQSLQWLGEVEQGSERRWALICDPAATPVTPLAERLVFDPGRVSHDPAARHMLGASAHAPLSEWLA
ncbi:MAG: YihY family inner membrane protein [Betaproteobacteria bacterium]|nr:YihY family inner membrane protein [Betaproteobacteria bacterium]